MPAKRKKPADDQTAAPNGGAAAAGAAAPASAAPAAAAAGGETDKTADKKAKTEKKTASKRGAAAAAAAAEEKGADSAPAAAAASAASGSGSGAAAAAAGGVVSTAARSVWWDSALGLLKCVDQRDLPLTYAIAELRTVQAVEAAIRAMTVRGAPAIGAAGGFGMAIAARSSAAVTVSALLQDLTRAKQLLDASRPTAVNLSWATARLLELAQTLAKTVAAITPDAIRSAVLAEAQALADDDVAINKTLAAFGAELVKPQANILHHCNTGRLATVDYGTALGVIYSAHEQGKKPHVWVDETRPRLQGARLTAWELMRAGVDLHLVVDGAAGLLMGEGKVDICFVGADRAVLNGDVANKIGTYKVAICAKEHGVPFYVCVPTSTIDLTLRTGKQIEIEERSRDEVVKIDGAQVAPTGCPVYNPAFDVTPAKYITGIITEMGVCYPPYEVSLTRAKQAKEEQIKAEWAKRLNAHAKAATKA